LFEKPHGGRITPVFVVLCRVIGEEKKGGKGVTGRAEAGVLDGDLAD